MEKPQKLKIELLYEPAIPLLELYPKEIKTLTQKMLQPHARCSIIMAAHENNPSVD